MTQYRSSIFEIADTYIDEVAALSPMTATALGVPGYEHLLDDFSYESAVEAMEHTRTTLSKLQAMEPIDEIDRVAKGVMVERLESNLVLHDTNERYITYGPIASPVTEIRQIFTLMPAQTEEQIAAITSRLNAVGAALESWKSCLNLMDSKGLKTARRQVQVISDQLRTHADGNYQGYAKSIDPEGTYPALHEAAKNAEAASLSMAQWMSDVHVPRSRETDGVGEERYAPWARYFTGANLNLRETYEWGLADLKRINDRIWELAKQVTPTATTLAEVAEQLEKSDHLAIEGTDALLTILKEFTQEAIANLEGKYFEIDDRIKFCDARLAPEGSAAAPYYIPPNEDLSRPGTTWYPTLGETRFNFWHIASTWYHEAVPGHHLQCATAIIEKDRLSRFQRTFAWISGYGEGWALYAERFMSELGAFEDPAMEIGYLSAQAMRAARIVVDIGMHCGYLDYEGKPWNAESAYKVLVERAMRTPAMAKSEIERYLGWPGQAISYKVGERYWLEIREAAKARLGDRFNIKDFHTYALKMGPIGLDPMKAEMANWDGRA